MERLAKQNEVLEKEVDYLKELVKIQKQGNRDNILIPIYAPARGATCSSWTECAFYRISILAPA